MVDYYGTLHSSVLLNGTSAAQRLTERRMSAAQRLTERGALMDGGCIFSDLFPGDVEEPHLTYKLGEDCFEE